MSVAKKLTEKLIDEKLLKQLIPLNSLSIDRLRELADKAVLESAAANRTLFRRGDNDTKTYYLLSGEVQAQLPSGQSVFIKADTPAALHPLADARPRKATLITKTNSSLLIIDTGLLDILLNSDRRHDYQVNEIYADDQSDWMTRFLQSLAVMNIPVKNIENLIQRMEELPVQAGDTVIRQTESDPQHYFVVKQGRCVVTQHVTSGKTPLRIAEINEGSGFGEEALLAHQPRNATVTMLTDGRIMRLKKADFTHLIAAPAVQYVDYPQACEMVSAGAVWLDTRSDAEFRRDGFTGSMHMPLATLRLKARDLNSYGKYITYCDNGNRAAAAAFLLRQMGYAALALADGMSGAAAIVQQTTLPNTPIDQEQRAQVTVAPLKLQSTRADTTSDTTLPAAELPGSTQRVAENPQVLTQARAEVEALRERMSRAEINAQEMALRLAQTDTVRTQLGAQVATLRTELEATRKKTQEELHHTQQTLQAEASQVIARHSNVAGALQAQLEENIAHLAAAEADYETTRVELDTLRREHERVKHEQTLIFARLKAEAEAYSINNQQIKQQLEQEVEQKQAAEAALLAAQREAARLKAEAEAARKRAEELMRRAGDSASQQSALMQEITRKIEAAEFMRLEAEEEAQRLREAMEMSRKRAEEETRRTADIEAARMKAQAESERRARLTEDIRRKADAEIASLKQEAENARRSAELAHKKSLAAEAARRQLEDEIKRAPIKTTPAPQVENAAQNDLEDLENEMAQLQEKLESKKRAAVSRQKELRKSAEKKVEDEPVLVQNVYDLQQKTQKLPDFKPNQNASADVGKVRKSGWISDAILWETTIGLRDDVEAEQALGGTLPPAQVAEKVALGKRQEPAMRALTSGELQTLRAQEAKRSVFTARDATPSTTQRKTEAPERNNNKIGLITVVAVTLASLVIGSIYFYKSDSESTRQSLSNSLEQATPSITTPHSIDNVNVTPSPLSGKAEISKALGSSNNEARAPQRKETTQKTLVETLPSTSPRNAIATPKMTEEKPASVPTNAQPKPMEPALTTNNLSNTTETSEIDDAAAEEKAEASAVPKNENIAPSESAPAPMFTDKAIVN